MMVLIAMMAIRDVVPKVELSWRDACCAGVGPRASVSETQLDDLHSALCAV